MAVDRSRSEIHGRPMHGSDAAYGPPDEDEIAADSDEGDADQVNADQVDYDEVDYSDDHGSAVPLRKPRFPRRAGIVILASVLALLVLLPGLIGVVSGFSKADGGHVIVVRNGGMFDDNSIRQVIQPNSGLTYTGLWSSDHPYPSSQRNFKVSGSKDADSNEVINVPTKDGVLVGVEGTFYFTLNTDQKVLEDFDNKFGTRTYPAGGKALHAWEDDDGWNAFLSFTIGNLVQNALRQQIGDVTCSDLVASCSLAQNNATLVVPTNGKGNQTIAQVEQAVNKGFTDNVQAILGVPILVNVQFALSKISLPENVQAAINDAQAAFASVTKSQAGLQSAKIDAQTNATKQQGYNACSTCAVIDELKALPPGITTYAPGGGFAITGQSAAAPAAPKK